MTDNKIDSYFGQGIIICLLFVLSIETTGLKFSK